MDDKSASSPTSSDPNPPTNMYSPWEWSSTEQEVQNVKDEVKASPNLQSAVLTQIGTNRGEVRNLRYIVMVNDNNLAHFQCDFENKFQHLADIIQQQQTTISDLQHIVSSQSKQISKLQESVLSIIKPKFTTSTQRVQTDDTSSSDSFSSDSDDESCFSSVSDDESSFSSYSYATSEVSPLLQGVHSQENSLAYDDNETQPLGDFDKLCDFPASASDECCEDIVLSGSCHVLTPPDDVNIYTDVRAVEDSQVGSSVISIGTTANSKDNSAVSISSEFEDQNTLHTVENCGLNMIQNTSLQPLNAKGLSQQKVLR